MERGHETGRRVQGDLGESADPPPESPTPAERETPHPNVTWISMRLRGIPRTVDGYRPPAHSIIDAPARLDSRRGGSLRLILDLGCRPFSGVQGIQVDLIDSHGFVTADVMEFEECEIPQETGWIGGVAYRVVIAYPPRGLPLNRLTCVSIVVTLDGVRFGVNSGGAYWVAHARESDEGTSTTASTPQSFCSSRTESR